MHRLFLKSQTRRVLSSAQLKINFPPEWNRTPRTQLSWPTLCIRRNQWAGACFKAKHSTIYAMANWVTPCPAPARIAFSFLKPIRTQSLSSVSIITSISALPTMRVPVLEGKQTEVFMWSALILLPTPSINIQSSQNRGWKTVVHSLWEDPHAERTRHFTEDKIQMIISISVDKPSYPSQKLHHSTPAFVLHILRFLVFLSNNEIWNIEAIKTVYFQCLSYFSNWLLLKTCKVIHSIKTGFTYAATTTRKTPNELTSVIRHMPVLMSHILMVLSLDPDSRKGPGLPLF